MMMSLTPLAMLEDTILVASGIFYAIASVIIWQSWRRERTELMTSFLAFMVSNAIGMAFMGLGPIYNSSTTMDIGTFAILIGSAFMLKFPLSFAPEAWRKGLFYVALVGTVVLSWWMSFTMSGMHYGMDVMNWFVIVIDGIVVGGLMIVMGLKAHERWFRVKSSGGGAGVMACCLVSQAATMSGAVITSAVFQFLAPIIMIGAIVVGRHYQQKEQQPAVATTPTI